MGAWKQRAKAAAVVGGRTERQLAAHFGTTVKTYNRRLDGGPTRLEEVEAQSLAEAVAVECGLPREFITADFRLLEAGEAAAKIDRVREALAHPATPTGDASTVQRAVDDFEQRTQERQPGGEGAKPPATGSE